MKDSALGIVVLCGAVLVGAIMVAGAFGLWQPVRVFIAEYTVKTETLRGESEFKRAEQNRKIQVEQARAELEAAQLRADAIAIVGKAAKDFPEYRKQEFIGAFAEAMYNGNIQKLIYVPTEANIPILEAGKR